MKLKHIYDINTFKAFEKAGVDFKTYDKIYEAASDFSNTVGFSQCLVGRLFNSVFSFAKKQAYKAMLLNTKRKLEDEYLRAIFKTFAQNGIGENDIRSTSEELLKQAAELIKEGDDWLKQKEYDKAVLRFNFALTNYKLANEQKETPEIAKNISNVKLRLASIPKTIISETDKLYSEKKDESKDECLKNYNNAEKFITNFTSNDTIKLDEKGLLEDKTKEFKTLLDLVQDKIDKLEKGQSPIDSTESPAEVKTEDTKLANVAFTDTEGYLDGVLSKIEKPDGPLGEGFALCIFKKIIQADAKTTKDYYMAAKESGDDAMQEKLSQQIANFLAMIKKCDEVKAVFLKVHGSKNVIKENNKLNDVLFNYKLTDVKKSAVGITDKTGSEPVSNVTKIVENIENLQIPNADVYAKIMDMYSKIYVLESVKYDGLNLITEAETATSTEADSKTTTQKSVNIKKSDEKKNKISKLFNDPEIIKAFPTLNNTDLSNEKIVAGCKKLGANSSDMISKNVRRGRILEIAIIADEICGKDDSGEGRFNSASADESKGFAVFNTKKRDKAALETYWKKQVAKVQTVFDDRIDWASLNPFTILKTANEADKTKAATTNSPVRTDIAAISSVVMNEETKKEKKILGIEGASGALNIKTLYLIDYAKGVNNYTIVADIVKIPSFTTPGGGSAKHSYDVIRVLGLLDKESMLLDLKKLLSENGDDEKKVWPTTDDKNNFIKKYIYNSKTDNAKLRYIKNELFGENTKIVDSENTVGYGYFILSKDKLYNTSAGSSRKGLVMKIENKDVFICSGVDKKSFKDINENENVKTDLGRYLGAFTWGKMSDSLFESDYLVKINPNLDNLFVQKFNEIVGKTGENEYNAVSVAKLNKIS